MLEAQAPRHDRALEEIEPTLNEQRKRRRGYRTLQPILEEPFGSDDGGKAWRKNCRASPKRYLRGLPRGGQGSLVAPIEVPVSAATCRVGRLLARRLVVTQRRPRRALTQALFEPPTTIAANQAMRQNGHRVAAGQRSSHVVSELELGRVQRAPGAVGTTEPFAGSPQCVAPDAVYAPPSPTLGTARPAAALSHRRARA